MHIEIAKIRSNLWFERKTKKNRQHSNELQNTLAYATSRFSFSAFSISEGWKSHTTWKFREHQARVLFAGFVIGIGIDIVQHGRHTYTPDYRFVYKWAISRWQCICRVTAWCMHQFYELAASLQDQLSDNSGT